MIYAAILAGGTGSRMKIDSMPKQFLNLGEKPIFIHTLEKFLLGNKFDGIYIGVHPDWCVHAEKIIREYGFNDKVTIVEGGSDRNSTIQNIITCIEQEFECNDQDIVVTHDAVRPFVSVRIIEDNIIAAKKYGACDTVIPATDTIVHSANGNNITDIPFRGHYYQGQTPQSFKLGILKKAFVSLDSKEKESLTDACKAVVLSGCRVALVEGSPANIKLTTVMDYRVAQSLIDRLPED